MSIIAWCYVEGGGTEWQAVCLNFDLAVQGRSVKEVQERLARAIQDYLEYVQTLPDESERERFLNRRVPLRTRIVFALRALVSALVVPRGPGGNQHLSYTVPCAA